MNSISPVIDEDHVKYEQVIALDQPQYEPIIIVPYLDVSTDVQIKAMSVRFRLTDEERDQIAKGGDLILNELTFSDTFTPIQLYVRMPGEY